MSKNSNRSQTFYSKNIGFQLRRSPTVHRVDRPTVSTGPRAHCAEHDNAGGGAGAAVRPFGGELPVPRCRGGGVATGGRGGWRHVNFEARGGDLILYQPRWLI